MQYSKVLAIIGFTASVFAAPAAEPVAEPEAAEAALEERTLPFLNLPVTLTGGNASCKSGSIYCKNDATGKWAKGVAGQTCQSGNLVCCNSAAVILVTILPAICGNQVDLNVPINISILS